MKRIVLFFSVIVLAVGMLSWYFFSSPVIAQNKQNYCFVVKPNTSLKQLISNLKVQGALKHPLLLYVYARISGEGQHIQAGEYCVDNGVRPKSFLAMLNEGKVMLHPFTIIDGWDVKQICQALLQEKSLKQDLAVCSSKVLAKSLGMAQGSAEGWLYPDTYFYTYQSSSLNLLSRAYAKMKKQLQEQWEKRGEMLPYKDAYQALISASIVEKESANVADEKIIAGVIVNRLNKRMPLQMDPTVIYGLGKKIVRHEDLRIDTRYNTYLHYGLPPTPICMPSVSAINAVLHPEQTDFIYYVANKKGTHQFSSTLAEHRLAIHQIYGK